VISPYTVEILETQSWTSLFDLLVANRIVLSISVRNLGELGQFCKLLDVSRFSKRDGWAIGSIVLTGRTSETLVAVVACVD
jgi:hypothetical protein